MTTLEEKLGYTFQNTALLENALTHSSCANESRGKLQSNERLEFLGDSILGMVVADHLYRNHPDLPEGELTRTRAALVCEESLVEVAAELNLGEYLRLGKGEESGGGCAWEKGRSPAADGTGPPFRPTQWRRCWRRSIWTAASDRPGRSSSGISSAGRSRD